MTFTPYSKEQSINRTKGILHKCSDGTELSQIQINRKLSNAYKSTPFSPVCQCCGSEPATEHDHTIAKARCKVLYKTELIWDSRNWSDSCRTCHMQFEQYKSGEFAQHLNIIERMVFLREHDFEGFKKRLPYIEDERVREAIL